MKGLGFRCHILPAIRKVVSTILSDWATRGSLDKVSTEKPWASTGIAHLPTAITDFFFRNIFKRIREILFTTLKQLTDKGKFSRNINGMCRRKFILQKCYELAVNPWALPFERHEQEWVGLEDWEKWKEEAWLIWAGTCKPPSAKAGRKFCKDANHLWVFA